jgi:methionyl-tRNA synthetase
VDPFVLLERFGQDRVRHYLLRHFPLGRDGDFSTAALAHASNDELGDQLGNLQNRVLVLLEQNNHGVVPGAAREDAALAREARRAAGLARDAFERCDPTQASASAFAFVRACNLELAQIEPWKILRRARDAADPATRAELQARGLDVLGDAARGLLWAAGLLEPLLPDTAARIARALGAALPAVYADTPPAWAPLGAGGRVERGAVLFERASA